MGFRIRKIINALGILVVLFFLAAPTLKAAVWVVDDLADPLPGTGTLTLRQAIANAAPGDTIHFFLPSSPAVISLTAGELNIDKDLTIIGPGARHLAIDAQYASRVFYLNAPTIYISGLSMFQGANSFGAGIYVTTGTSVQMEQVGIRSCNASGGAGGGIYNRGTLALYDSEIYGNWAGSGGGVRLDQGVANFTNCTFSGNSANSTNGGGIEATVNGQGNFEHCTIYLNSSSGNGGGIYDNNGTQVSVAHTIIAGNTSIGGGPDLFVSGAGNILGNNSLLQNNSGGNLTGVGNIVGAPPNLGPIQFNGGDTRTHALLTGSPCIDNGDPSFTGPPDFDQRGVPRLLDGDESGGGFGFGSVIDIGAFEYSPFCVDNTSGSQSTPGSLPYWLDYINNVTLADPPYYLCFAINGAGPHIIQPANTMQRNYWGEIIIDGYSQQNAYPAGGGQVGVIEIQIDGVFLPANSWGIAFDSGSELSQLKGVSIINVIGGTSDMAVDVQTDNIGIYGNYLGVDAQGNNPGPNQAGVHIDNGASTTMVGTSSERDRNVISNNSVAQVVIANAGVGNRIIGNFIGTNPMGLASMGGGSTSIGIHIFGGTNTLIGGSTGIGGNVISGLQDGIVYDNAGVYNDLIIGNLIGVDTRGSGVIGNTGDGIRLNNGTRNVVIGSSNWTERNIISGNSGDGVHIEGSSTTDNQVIGNFIGITYDTLIASNNIGVSINNGGVNNTIGGATTAHGNVISGNNAYGINLNISGPNNQIMNNIIGSDPTGTQTGFGNNGHGIYIGPGSNLTTIGGNQSVGNIISGNAPATGSGVYIAGSYTTVAGNIIGANQSGTGAVANYGGILIQDGTENVIGGSNANEGNLISGNTNNGITISGTSATGNKVLGNYIGTEITGMAGLANGGTGVSLVNGAYYNNIGGPGALEHNVISNNGAYGVIVSSGCVGDTIRGNLIGTNRTGISAMANAGDGIRIINSNTTVIGGGAANEGNLISGNGGSGIVINGTASLSNVIHGNVIGLDSLGNILGNVDDGITLSGGAYNNYIGGTNASERNIISGNGNQGIELSGAGDDNQLFNNFIGVGLTGTNDRGNVASGIWINSTNGSALIGAVGAGNIISGNDVNGIYIGTDASVVVQSNYIGTDALFNNIGNSSSGLQIEGDDNIIGGATSTHGNVIAFNGAFGINNLSSASHNAITFNTIANNGSDGVFIFDGINNAIQYNNIHDNVGLGIDLDSDGVDPNDGLDTDNGANGIQNYPVLNSASSCNGTNTLITGTLTSIPSSTFNIDFFVIPGGNQDPSGNGEGDAYLTSITVNTNASGVATINYSHPTLLTPGDYIAATATYMNSGVAENTSEFSAHVVIAAQLTASSPIVNDISCNGLTDGSIQLIGNDGALPLQYSIDGGTTFQASATFSGLAAGTYPAVIEDANGCQVTGNVTIIEPAAVSITNITVVDVSCNGLSDGTVTITAAGGTPTYQYSIDNGITFQGGSIFTGVPPGTYNVVVEDANACQVNQVVTVTEPPVVTHLVTVVDENCGMADGSLTITAAGGDGGPYQFSLDNGATFTASINPYTYVSGAGTFNVIVQDGNGCQSVMSTETISNIPGVTLNGATVVDVSCNGLSDGSITIFATGGTTPYQYSIDGGGTFQGSSVFSGLTANTYTVVVVDNNGCTATQNYTVNEPALLTTGSTVGTATCNGNCDGFITLNGLGGTTPYQYSIDNGVTFQAGTTFNGLCVGSYNVVVMDANGCLYNTVLTVNEPPVLTVNISTSVDPSCQGFCDGLATATGNGGTPPYTFSWDDPGNQSTATATGLCAGTYTVTVYDFNGCGPVTANITLTDPPVVTYTVSVVDENCGLSDGQITLTGGGGDGGPYQYSIDNGITFQASGVFAGLTAGAYSIIVEDGSGCQIAGTENVNSASGVTITNLNFTDPLCNGDANGTITITAGGGLAPYQYSIDNGVTYQASNSFTGLLAGSYIAVVQDFNGCIYNTPVTLTDPPALSGTTASVDASCDGSCNGQASITTTGGMPPYSFQWYTSGNLPIGGNSDTLFNACADGYYVIVTDNNGCTYTSGTVTVNQPAPLIPNVVSTDVTCNGLCDGILTITATGGTTPYQYTKDNGNSWWPNGNFVGVCAANWDVIVQDANGCTAVYGTVTINEPLAVSYVDSIADENCGQGDGYIGLTGSGGDGNFQYSIDNGGSYQPSGAFPGLTAGTYDIIVQDGNGCQATGQIVVSNSTGVVLNGTIENDPICNGSSDGDITVNATGGLTPYQYSIDGGATWQSGNVFTGLVAGNYDVIIEDANGCQSTSTIVTLNDPALEDASFSYTTNTFCDNDVNPVATITGVQGGVFSEFTGDVAFINVTTGEISLTGSVPGLYYIVYTTPNCFNVDSVAISIVASPTPAITPVGPYCENDAAVNLSATPGGGSWSGPGVTNSSLGEFTPGTAGVGTHEIVYEVTVNGCTGTDTTIIDVLATPDATITATGPLCIGLGDITLTAATGGGTWSGTGIVNGNTGLFNTGTAGIGTHVISYTVTVNGCTSVDNEVIIVHPLPTVSFSGLLASYCANDPVVTLVGNPVGGTYTGVGISGNTFDPNVAGAGVHSISYTYTDGNGCTNVDVQVVTVNVVPLPPTGQASYFYCPGDPIDSIGVTGVVGTVTNWYSDAQLTNNIGTSDVIFPPGIGGPGVYNYFATSTLPSGCESDPFQVTITVATPAFVNAGAPQSICLGDSVQLLATGGVTYQWFGDTTLSDPNIASPSAMPQTTTTYYVAITTAGNCTFVDSVVVVVDFGENCGWEIYNAFSPDGDGVNDTWIIDGIQRFPNNKVMIFNRWGDQLIGFENYDNAQEVWNGTNEGGDVLPSGTYFYVIEVEGSNRQFSGWVQLSR